MASPCSPAPPQVALPLVLFAQIAADREHHMDASTQPGKMTWRSHRPAEARYLVQLRDIGYTLSEVEQLVVDLVDPSDADAHDTEASDGDIREADSVDDVAPVAVLSTADAEANDRLAEPAPLSVVPDSDSDGDSDVREAGDVAPLAVVPDSAEDLADPTDRVDGPAEGDAAVPGDTA